MEIYGIISCVAFVLGILLVIACAVILFSFSFPPEFQVQDIKQNEKGEQYIFLKRVDIASFAGCALIILGLIGLLVIYTKIVFFCSVIIIVLLFFFRMLKRI